MWDIMWDHLDKSNVQFNGIIYTSEIKAQYKIISKPIKKPSKKRSHSLLHDLVTILFFDCIIVLGKWRQTNALFNGKNKPLRCVMSKIQTHNLFILSMYIPIFYNFIITKYFTNKS